MHTLSSVVMVYDLSQWYIQPQPCIDECVGMWLITGTIEPQMSRNVADSGLCMSIYVHVLACYCIALYV